MAEFEIDSEWDRDEGHETSYTNNMVTKYVEAYSNDSHVVLITKTKVSPGWTVELYKTPNKRLVKFENKVETDDVESVAENMMGGVE